MVMAADNERQAAEPASEPEHECLAATQSQQRGWSLSQTAGLGDIGSEELFRDKAAILDTDVHTSVSNAILHLNTPEGNASVPEGFCIVLSESRRRYFLLYKEDRKAHACALFNLVDDRK